MEKKISFYANKVLQFTARQQLQYIEICCLSWQIHTRHIYSLLSYNTSVFQ